MTHFIYWIVDENGITPRDLSVPEPFNPFDKQDKPEPEPTEDWDDDEDD